MGRRISKIVVPFQSNGDLIMVEGELAVGRYFSSGANSVIQVARLSILAG